MAPIWTQSPLCSSHVRVLALGHMEVALVLTVEIDSKVADVLISVHAYIKALVLLGLVHLLTLAMAVTVNIDDRSTVRVEPPTRERSGGSSASSDTST